MTGNQTWIRSIWSDPDYDLGQIPTSEMTEKD